MLPLSETEPVPYPDMNYVGKSNAEMIILIQRLQKQITTLVNHPPPNPSDPLKKRVRHQRAKVIKYRWSHGACAHARRDCTRKRQGYKDDVIFTNKMSGSMYYCQALVVTPAPEST